MPPRRLTGSDRAIPHPAMRSAGHRLIRPSIGTCPTTSAHSQLAPEQIWSVRDERTRQEAAIELLEDEVAAGRRRLERPRYARLHASLAERPLESAWQHFPDNARAPGQSERIDARPARGWSARGLWLGGVGFALLAVGVISAVATVQSSRPLPFEIWARHDLMRGAGDLAGGTYIDAMGAGQFASPPMIGPESAAAGLRPEAVAASLPAAAERDPADAALAWDSSQESPEVDIAALGPILASADAAAKLAADWPAPRTTARAVPESRSERLLLEPPRPVFKPTLVSSLQPDPDAPARPRSRP
jgi:hypothetical protein